MWYIVIALALGFVVFIICDLLFPESYEDK